MPPLERCADWVARLGFVGMGLLLLFAVAAPLSTADTWLHLKLGEAYARQGPWLDADPILYLAEGPPATTAWLSQLALHAIQAASGFQGLRVAHLICAAGILALAGSTLWRAGCSSAAASLGLGIFVALAGLRLEQLRPHLFTIAASFLVVRLLIEPRAGPSSRRIALATLLMGLWANAHAGFVLGPILLVAATGGVLLGALIGPGSRRPAGLRRARTLALAVVLASAATFANPDGAAPHLAYRSAGVDSPGLDIVIDEWQPFPFFGPLWPGLPPSPTDFVLGWLLILAAPLLGIVGLGRIARGDDRADPALIGVACAAAVAMALAMRFQWLGLWTLVLAVQLLRAQLPRPRVRLTAATLTLGLGVGWLHAGDWPQLAQDLPRTVQGYARPYRTAHYFGHATWFLQDAAIQGHLFTRYSAGNFQGYWLAPGLRPFLAGALNVPAEVAESYLALTERRGRSPLDFEATLDRYEIDVFMGVGVPIVPHDARARPYTARHLEDSAGWTLIYRNLRSSLWLRRNARNAANLDRVTEYYRGQGVPFDPQTGLEVARVIRDAPGWATSQGLIPTDFARLRSRANAGAQAASNRLAMVYAAIGLCDRAIDLDRRVLEQRNPLGARRRLVWCLLQQGRADEARQAAARFEQNAPPGTVARLLADAAREVGRLGSEADRAELVATLLVFTRDEATPLFSGFRNAEPRGRASSGRP